MANNAERDPRHHTQKMQKTLHEIIDHLREDIQKVDEPQLKALFETSAEVLGCLAKAFRDYEQKKGGMAASDRRGRQVRVRSRG